MAVISCLRVSTDEQNAKNQIQQIEAAGYAVEKDFQFCDEGISGSVPANKRPTLNDAMK